MVFMSSFRLCAPSTRFVSYFALVVVVAGLTGCQSAPTPAPGSYEDLVQRVAVLEGQMKDAQPTLKKVDVMESHFKTLSLELGRISTTYHVPDEPPVAAISPTVQPKQDDVKVEPKHVPEKVAKTEIVKKETIQKAPVKKTTPVNGPLAVTSVRVGEQPKDVTRIVLDTSKPAEIHYDLDNGEGLLVIDVAGAAWSASQSQAIKNSAMVKSFHASHDGDGAHLVVDLKRAAKVVATARLKPEGGSGNRVYVDVAPAK